MSKDNIIKFCTVCGKRLGYYSYVSRYDPVTGLPVLKYVVRCEDYGLGYDSFHGKYLASDSYEEGVIATPVPENYPVISKKKIAEPEHEPEGEWNIGIGFYKFLIGLITGLVLGALTMSILIHSGA